jgi:diguanylate cyclase
MLSTVLALKDVLYTVVALMALLAVAYGTFIRARSLERTPGAQMILGTLFGGAAVLAMHDPLRVAEGVIVDLRNVPVVLAAAFLGAPGLAMALLVALAGRAEIGGLGTAAGLTGIVASGLAGLAWARLVQPHPCHGRRNILLLAAASLVQFPTFFLLPWDLAWRSVSTLWPILVPLHLTAVLATGLLLERERLIAAGEARLSQAATRDPLTGLLNRRGFETAVACLRQPKRGLKREFKHGAALLVLDLDHFKRVNDCHGHPAGDTVLQQLGTRLELACQPGDVVARFGGEEVVVLVPNVGPQGAKAAAARLCHVVAADPFALPCGRALRITASVGGVWTGGSLGLDELLGRADAALYAAKAAGRNAWRVGLGWRIPGMAEPQATAAQAVPRSMALHPVLAA